MDDPEDDVFDTASFYPEQSGAIIMLLISGGVGGEVQGTLNRGQRN
ncbi:hypothetical protein OZL92_02120 [Bacillus sonorensis]|uniref:Uncharacterized protein n=1 Tax=Bacillus sonorensis TaxID=119858 RepID=A0ABM6LFX0_9BACI|nr:MULTISPECIES: hypothetical protein [Bacillus]ASB88172.1 hypothetical protein S101395_01663 [Bacillus sonorensis]MCF7617573.1 hypothetical protein [Bacillus sonorensis]MCY7856290.1 hypothetical protein [Bacillus sonorensis]MCY8025985.1 hypothetical protein [Bacillus sonorensis]MCY8034985.1 hypothetical protein [Bacillus sonorensis]